eukprot:789341-Alexandrium_andersonii.AAC.1
MTRDWGMHEWERRRASDLYRNDNDPDCNLPRTQAYGNFKDLETNENYKDQRLEFSTKAKANPKAKQ